MDRPSVHHITSYPSRRSRSAIWPPRWVSSSTSRMRVPKQHDRNTPDLAETLRKIRARSVAHAGAMMTFERFTIPLALALFANACHGGGSTAEQEPDAAPAACTSFAACGGDPVGEWQ